MNSGHAQGNWIQNIMKSHQVAFVELVKSLHRACCDHLQRQRRVNTGKLTESIMVLFNVADKKIIKRCDYKKNDGNHAGYLFHDPYAGITKNGDAFRNMRSDKPEKLSPFALAPSKPGKRI